VDLNVPVLKAGIARLRDRIRGDGQRYSRRNSALDQ
jgi:hypothetical protein